MTPSLLLALALQTVPGEASPPTPAPPPAATLEVYEAQVRGAFARSQSLQGPLDGAWTLKDASGAGLFRFQLVDPGFAGGQVEGAWSDLRTGPGGPSGFFTGVAREGPRLTLQFAGPAMGLAVATLDLRPDGGFAGQLTLGAAGQGSRPQAVTLVRP